MTLNDTFPNLSANYLADEADVLASLVKTLNLTGPDRDAIRNTAIDLVASLRTEGRPVPLMDALLQEYGLSTEEGVALMRLSEALIRTPDFVTSRKLIRDKLIDSDWAGHAGQAPDFLVNQATNGLRLSAGWIKLTGGIAASNIAAKLGDQVLGLVMNRVMGVMAEHFVLGKSIEDAVKNAREGEQNGQTYSYDMLGEAALTAEDAETYFQAYKHAVAYLAENTDQYSNIADAPGISVKLSALHPRYEHAKRETCVPPLVDKLIELASIAKKGTLSLAIDAEETDRLELSLLVFERLLNAPELADWDGLGMVVQAYQRRAIPVLERIVAATRKAGRKITIRLVKGAYWDSEIKRAQELGLESYPVFTRKENTDVSYLSCARVLLKAKDVIFPQFATHNAHTAAAISHMASNDQPYEIQRLHGMGKTLHEALTDSFGTRSRIYAPVGAHEDLLPYLVRRLLENGANSSFVNQIFDTEVELGTLVADPITIATAHADAANPKLPIPCDIAEDRRMMAKGLDLTQAETAAEAEARMALPEPLHLTVAGAGAPHLHVHNPARRDMRVGTIQTHDEAAVDTAVRNAAASAWATSFSPPERAACLQRAADLLEENMHDLLRLCTLEAGKSLPDGVAEVREAVDFCRYYAAQAQSYRIMARPSLGVVACISPWNFPLAIFIGQIAAALSVGNTVVAKPAEQTPLISHMAVDLLERAGVPGDAVQLLIGDGALLGSALTSHADVKGICFTGSTATAKRIATTLADTGRATIPFIAETGGINTMIVDSTALLEQAVQDVVASAFQSAGQRCSACRIVCVQEDIADDFITMLSGAMDALTVGDPAKLSTDVGPVIDTGARRMIEDYIEEARLNHKTVGEVPMTSRGESGNFVTPIAFEINRISDVKREIFGPVLHVLRFKAKNIDALIEDINATGYGLTMGLHTRLDHRIEAVAASAHVGNLYVNRNQIGAVVGVQPFGGEGLSGTGPKAGGPNYLLRLSKSGQTARITEIEKEEDRVARIHALFMDSQIAESAIWERAGVPLELSLPGPTGEQNTLRLHPRGKMLCIGGDVPRDIARQIALCLIAGNTVLALETPETMTMLNKLKAALEDHGFDNDTLTLVSAKEADALIEGDIKGVTADGSQRETLAAKLCRRDGPILPLLSADTDVERFYHERTVTINTTAAGGNASLLAMS